MCRIEEGGDHGDGLGLARRNSLGLAVAVEHRDSAREHDDGVDAGVGVPGQGQ